MPSFKFRNPETGEFEKLRGGVPSMLPSVYDPQGKKTDIFAYVDEKAGSGGISDGVAIDISNEDLLTYLAAGKSGFYRGGNIANSPDPDYWWYFTIIGDEEGFSTVTAKRSRTGKIVYEASYNPTDGLDGWYRVVVNHLDEELIVDSNIKGTYVIGEWLQTTTDTHLNKPAEKFAVLDKDGWVYHRTAEELRSDIGAAGSGVTVHTATIGTTWTEDSDTGVKSQNVAIEGVTAENTATVDHVFTDGTEYVDFVEAENQYLEFITNGYAETYDGGVTFHIFGDAPTVAIPIVVEVV